MRKIITFTGFLSLVCLNSFQLLAEKVTFQLHMNMPEWNGKQICDQGAGVKLAPINAPSISYNFIAGKSEIKDARYEYMWEQQRNNESWTSIKQGKDAYFVPGLNPENIVLDSKESPINYSYRLRIRDQINDSDWITSEVYTASIGSALKINYQIQEIPSEPSKATINLTVNGGFLVKTFQWSGEHLKEEMKTLQNIEKVAHGIYEVIVRDGCSENKVVINTKETKPRQNN